MSGKIRRLGDAEWEIMQVIWGTGGPVRASEIQEKLKDRRPWPLSTLMTSLGRMADKGFLSCEKEGRNNWYRPLISEAEYKAEESRSFLSRLYGNSLTGLVSAMYAGKAVGKEELEELRRLLDELTEKE